MFYIPYYQAAPMYHAYIVNYAIYFKHFMIFIFKIIKGILKLYLNIYVIENKSTMEQFL